MKELSIEEKAKAYDEKLDVARHIYADPSVKDEDKYYIEVIFPELKESEDERIRKAIISAIEEDWPGHTDWIDWLEKQGGHAKFINGIQVGDKVTRNEDGVLVNLSQLKRVAKKDEKQSEQKPAWSEEDETGLMNTIIMLKEGASLHFNKKDITKAVDWLKSLRPQNRWKPSDEQMKALEVMLTVSPQTPAITSALIELYEQLKKLK